MAQHWPSLKVVVAAAQVVEAPVRVAQLAQVVVPLALVAVLLVAVLAQAAVSGMEQSPVLAQAPAVLRRVEQPVWVQAQGHAELVLTQRVNCRRRKNGKSFSRNGRGDQAWFAGLDDVDTEMDPDFGTTCLVGRGCSV